MQNCVYQPIRNLLYRRTEGHIYFSRKGAEGAKLYVLLFFCLKLNGTHSKRRDVIPWRLPLTQTPQTHAAFVVSHRTHGIHRINLDRRTDLFLTQRRRGREAICSFVLLYNKFLIG